MEIMVNLMQHSFRELYLITGDSQADLPEPISLSFICVTVVILIKPLFSDYLLVYHTLKPV